MSYLQILITNMKGCVRHMLGRIKIFSLFETEMIKDGWRNRRVCNGVKSNHATSYKEKLKITKINQNTKCSLFRKHWRPREFHLMTQLCMHLKYSRSLIQFRGLESFFVGSAFSSYLDCFLSLTSDQSSFELSIKPNTTVEWNSRLAFTLRLCSSPI